MRVCVNGRRSGCRIESYRRRGVVTEDVCGVEADDGNVVGKRHCAACLCRRYSVILSVWRLAGWLHAWPKQRLAVGWVHEWVRASMWPERKIVQLFMSCLLTRDEGHAHPQRNIGGIVLGFQLQSSIVRAWWTWWSA